MIERGFRQISTAKGRRRLVVAVPPTFGTQWFSPRLGSLALELFAPQEGAGLAIVDRNMIVEELADNELAQFSDIEVAGPFGYWLDVAQRHATLEYVQAIGGWLREEVLKGG
jgi:hypothetical protein